jgi:hypothetical protein
MGFPQFVQYNLVVSANKKVSSRKSFWCVENWCLKMQMQKPRAGELLLSTEFCDCSMTTFVYFYVLGSMLSKDLACCNLQAVADTVVFFSRAPTNSHQSSVNDGFGTS